MIIQLTIHLKQKNKNKRAHIFFIYCTLCVMVNLIIFIVQWFYLFDNKSVEGKIYLWGFGITVIFNLFSSLAFGKASEYEYTSDFLVFKHVKQYLKKRTCSESERKAVTAFVFYPLWIVGQLPFGLFVLLYVIPLSLFIFIGIECRNLFNWMSGGSMLKQEKDNEKTMFKDYYLILDLPNHATSLDVERSFNHFLAQYNSTSERNQNRELWFDLQEAYRVLISENRLRPLYDREYMIYDNYDNRDNYELSNPYVFSDKKLERDIMLIRESLRREITRSKRYRKINIVVVSLIIWVIVASVVGLYFAIDKSSNHRMNHHRGPVFSGPVSSEELDSDLDLDLDLDLD